MQKINELPFPSTGDTPATGQTINTATSGKQNKVGTHLNSEREGGDGGFDEHQVIPSHQTTQAVFHRVDERHAAPSFGEAESLSVWLTEVRRRLDGDIWPLWNLWPTTKPTATPDR